MLAHVSISKGLPLSKTRVRFGTMSSFRVTAKGPSPKEHSARLGVWTFNQDLEIPTPNFLLHTQAGSVPHLTPCVLSKVFPSPQPVLFCLDGCITFLPPLAKYGRGLASFAVLPWGETTPSLLSLHNPLEPLKAGYNTTKGVALWGRMGKASLEPEQYRGMREAVKASAYQNLSDYDVGTSLKRLKKSMTRSLDFLLKGGEGQGLFFTLESPWFAPSSSTNGERTLKEALASRGGDIAGFILHFPDLEKSKKPAEEGDSPPPVTESVEKIVSLLPAEKARYISGPFSLKDALHLVRKGVDLLDSSFVTRMAEEGQAFQLDKIREKFAPASSRVHQFEEDLPTREIEELKDIPSAEEEGVQLSLKDKAYFSDFSPISKTCACYTCRKHTRAYINHLYATDELLGPVLLMIHNLTNLQDFFSLLRAILSSDQQGDFDTLERLLTN